MATRAIFKLLPRKYIQSTSCSSKISLFDRHCKAIKHTRSYSQPNHSVDRSKNILHVRKVSRSLQNFRENRQTHDAQEEPLGEKEPPEEQHSTRGLISMSAREVKKPVEIVEDTQEHDNPIYEVTDGYRSTEHFYDVLGYMKNAEQMRSRRLFAHLQPGNLKPYGSNETLQFPDSFNSRRRTKVVYPIMGTSGASAQETPSQQRIDEVPHREHSSFPQEPTLNEVKRLRVSESRSNYDINTKRYSTSYLTARKITTKAVTNDGKLPKLSLSSHFLRKSSSYLKKDKKKVEISELYRRVSTHKDTDDFSKKSTENFILCDSFPELSPKSERYTHTECPKPKKICEEYVTVKLGKKSKLKKLPKLKPGDCPCIDPPPLVDVPMKKLKARPVPVPQRVCPPPILCPPRADEGMVVKAKKLRPIKPAECPCLPDALDEGKPLKRLEPKPVKEPPKICPVDVLCEEYVKAVPKVVRKKLPVLKAPPCPCIDPPPLVDVPMKKLKPKPVVVPERVCPPPILCPPRADEGLKIKPKKLPIIVPGQCPCIESILEDVPLKRLVPKPVKEPPRICPVDVTCEDRDKKKPKVVRKKLPVLKAPPCPCIDPPPLVDVPMKKLKPKPVPVPERVCPPPDQCPPRADEGMVVKPKKLRPIKPVECPCLPDVLDEGKPLKRLEPKPVKEPPKICPVDVVCEEYLKEKPKVARKRLPRMKPSTCPCIDPPPQVDPPPLKKLKPRPVPVPPRVCPPSEHCPPRADEGMVVKQKKLPVMPLANCPCVEPEPPEDTPPLARLKMKPVPEPKRICPKADICDETPRADADDWMYWKIVEVKCPEVKCEKPKKKPKKPKKTRRCYSTTAMDVSKRSYSTNCEPCGSDFLRLKCDLTEVQKDNKDKESNSYNVIIDIKPSAPLILTQEPIQKCSKDVTSIDLRRCKSEPPDCVTFIIYKNSDLKCTTSKSGLVKEPPEGVSTMTLFSNINRFISTCSALRALRKEDEYQPKNKMLKEREKFIEPFPTEEDINRTRRKSRMYYRTRKDEAPVAGDEDCEDGADDEALKDVCGEPGELAQQEKKLSLWERIVNYFKARPCPSPEEFKQMRLKAAAEKAAEKAGLCVYDPKEFKCEKELPKVITAATVKEELKKC